LQKNETKKKNKTTSYAHIEKSCIFFSLFILIIV